MNNRTRIEFEIFQTKLEEIGIKFYLDSEVRDDGERLENYIFEKDEIIIKIIEKIMRRESGQSHIFVPTRSKNKGEDFKLIPLTDQEFYKQWLFLIKRQFENYVDNKKYH